MFYSQSSQLTTVCVVLHAIFTHTHSLSLTKQLEITSSSLFIRKSLFFLGKLSISSAALSLYVPLKAKSSFNVTEAQNVNKHVFRLLF